MFIDLLLDWVVYCLGKNEVNKKNTCQKLTLFGHNAQQGRLIVGADGSVTLENLQKTDLGYYVTERRLPNGDKHQKDVLLIVSSKQTRIFFYFKLFLTMFGENL